MANSKITPATAGTVEATVIVDKKTAATYFYTDDAAAAQHLMRGGEFSVKPRQPVPAYLVQ